MKKLLLLLAVLLLAALPALAEVDITLTAAPCRLDYDFTVPGQNFVYLTFKNNYQQGSMTLYSEDCHYAGSIDLVSSYKGGLTNVTLQNVHLQTIGKDRIELPADESYPVPTGNSDVRVQNLKLIETPEGFIYSFNAPGADFMLLDCHSRQEDFTLPVYPMDDEGNFMGKVTMPLTYARTQMTISVCNFKGHVKKDAICYKGYEAPAKPEIQPGRLSGLVVCIDPGHQEQTKFVSEQRGPGWTQKSSTTPGMALGTHTLRRESIVVLEIAMKLRDALMAEGATVVMTREIQDTFVSNIERADIAANAGAHILLRLHCDNSSQQNRTGINIYIPRDSEYAKAVADQPTYEHMGQLLLDQMKTAVGYDLIEHTGVVRANNNYIGSNWAQMPCFLIEMGFMSNKREDLLLAHSTYQQWLAEGMVNGIYDVAVFRGILQ